MDRAERMRQSRQSMEVGCRPPDQSRQLEELGRLLMGAHSKLLAVNQQIEVENAKLQELKALVAGLEQRSHAAHSRLRQFQALELASQAALKAYNAELTLVTQTLQSSKQTATRSEKDLI